MVLAAAALAAAAAGSVHDDARAAEVARINAIPGLTWRAGVAERFRGAPAGASKPLLGVKADHAENLEAAKRLGLVTEVGAAEGFVAADSFDSATNWPKCAKVITDIRDQSNCGCCWAFGAAEAASDRLCIATDGATQVPLSAQDMCFCGSSNGCGGGYVNGAWSRIKQYGLVTGSQQQPDDGKTDPFAGLGLCSSFSLPHCHHHGPTGSDPYPAEGAKGCPSESSAKCPSKCDSAASKEHSNFTSDKWTFTGNVESYGSEKAIQQAVQTYGPIEVAFTVYSDFENYAGGIYTKTSSQQMGGHAVKLVGWGVENGVKYWKIANSWNPYWGENGYFRIKRGSNECGIESQGGANSGSGKWTQGASPVPPAPADCMKQIDKDCGAVKGNQMQCMQCMTQNLNKYMTEGCDMSALMQYCMPGSVAAAGPVSGDGLQEINAFRAKKGAAALTMCGAEFDAKAQEIAEYDAVNGAGAYVKAHGGDPKGWTGVCAADFVGTEEECESNGYNGGNDGLAWENAIASMTNSCGDALSGKHKCASFGSCTGCSKSKSGKPRNYYAVNFC